MTKQEFLSALRSALGKLPEQEIRASLDFYSEAIDDRMEDGASEEEAVAALGNVDEIAAQIIAETPPIPKAVVKMKTKSRTANIVLAVVLSPIWVPLALAFVLCVAAIYLSLWCVIVALWACVVVLILCAPIGIAGLIYCFATGYPLTGVWLLGCGLAGSGLGLFALMGMNAVSRGLVQLTGMFARSVKGLFVRKGGAEAIGQSAAAAAESAKRGAASAAEGMRGVAASAAESVRETAAVAAAGARGAIAGAKTAVHDAKAAQGNEERTAQQPAPPTGEPVIPGSAPSPTAPSSTASRYHDAPVPPPGYPAQHVTATLEGDRHDDRA